MIACLPVDPPTGGQNPLPGGAVDGVVSDMIPVRYIRTANARHIMKPTRFASSLTSFTSRTRAVVGPVRVCERPVCVVNPRFVADRRRPGQKTWQTRVSSGWCSLVMMLTVGWLTSAGSLAAENPQATKVEDAVTTSSPAVLERNRALRVAKQWVELVDRGDYARSWTDSAAYLKTRISEELWVEGMTNGRAPAGKVTLRKLRSVQYRNTIAGAPAGEYMVVAFETTFEQREATLEVVTPMRDPDGRWRVASYRVQ